MCVYIDNMTCEGFIIVASNSIVLQLKSLVSILDFLLRVQVVLELLLFGRTNV